MQDQNLKSELRYRRLQQTTRRHFLRDSATGLGALWLATQNKRALAAEGDSQTQAEQHHSGSAKRVIFLHMIGAPSQLELFDFKPDLKKLDGQDCPQSFLDGKRFAFIQGTPKMLGHQYPFKQHGECGAWVSDRLPEFAKHVDDVCFIKSMQTDQFNHGPAQLMVHAGQPRMGYPSIAQYELAYRMQSAVPEVMGLEEPDQEEVVFEAGKSV